MRAWGATPKMHLFLHRISNNPPILGIQKHLRWHIWCRGMHAWAATPKAHIFWHHALQTIPPSWVPKNTSAGRVGAEVCALGAPRQKRTCFGIVHFKRPLPRCPETLLLAYLVQRYGILRCHVKTPRFLAHSTTHSKPPGLIHSQIPAGLKNNFQSLVCHPCTAVASGCKIP